MKGTNLLKGLLVFALAVTTWVVLASESDIDVLLDKVEANLTVDKTLAQKLAEHAQALLEDKDLPHQHVRLLNLQAHISLLKFELNNAFAQASEAEAIAAQIGNQLQQAEAIRKQGIVYFLLDADADALDLLRRSLEIHAAIDSDYVLNNLQAIGNVYAKHSEWTDDLIDIGKQLVEQAVIKNSTHFEAQGYGFVIQGLSAQEELAKAVQIAEQALLAINEESHGYYLVLFHLAKTEFLLSNYQIALAYIDNYLGFIRLSNIPLAEIKANLLKAEILIASNQLEQGESLLKQSLQQATDAKYRPFQKQALEKLSDYYAELGEDKQALAYLNQYVALKEQDFNATQANQLAFNRARLDVLQKNQRINELEFSEQLSQQQNRYQFYIIVLAILVIVLLIGRFVRTSRQKRELRKYSQELEHASEAKSEFLARMSHEIRTPINAVIGLAKLTRKSALTQEQDLNLDQIESSSQSLLRVINDILDFSKIEAGKLDIEQAPFELDKLVDRAVKLESVKAHEKGIELVQYIARDVPIKVVGDSLRLQQILTNLLSNAIKFTQRGVVSVSVNRKYAEQRVLLEFSIKDTGIGLNQAQQDKLFQTFSQADESITRMYGGTGLGLAICKQLVEMMGGKIWVESQPNQGSTFYFTIVVDEKNEPDQFSKAGEKTHLSSLRVLVADDLELSRRATAEALLRLKINPDVAENGAQTISNIRLAAEQKAPYDIVIIDWKMPDIDGIEVASIINQQFAHLKPKIIMLSAHNPAEVEAMGRPLGVECFMEKPINISSLLNNILTLTNHAVQPVDDSSGESHPVPDFSGVHILLVEDNELNRKVAKGFLSETHAQIALAENGEEALMRLRQEPAAFDLVLMDIQMPVMDGLTACQHIRTELGLTLPVVAMTANAMKGDIDKSIAAGMNAHISKPFEPSKLYSVLSDCLAGKPVVGADALAGEHTGRSPNAAWLSSRETEQSALTKIDKKTAMAKLFGKEPLYQELLNDFFAMEPQLEHLQASLASHDNQAARFVLHAYKSALSYIGANDLAQFALDIEAELMAKPDSIDEATKASIARFIQAIQQLKTELSA